MKETKFYTIHDLMKQDLFLEFLDDPFEVMGAEEFAITVNMLMQTGLFKNIGEIKEIIRTGQEIDDVYLLHAFERQYLEMIHPFVVKRSGLYQSHLLQKVGEKILRNEIKNEDDLKAYVEVIKDDVDVDLTLGILAASDDFIAYGLAPENLKRDIDKQVARELVASLEELKHKQGIKTLKEARQFFSLLSNKPSTRLERDFVFAYSCLAVDTIRKKYNLEYDAVIKVIGEALAYNQIDSWEEVEAFLKKGGLI